MSTRSAAVTSLSFTAVLLVGATACSIEPPLERRNPYDPDGIYELSLTGPDSSHFVGEVLQFAMHAQPELPPGDLLIHWDVFDEISDLGGRPILSPHVNPGPNQTFVIRSASARYRRQTAVATIGENQFGWSWMMGQKVMDLDFLCGPGQPPAGSCEVPFNLESPVATLSLAMRDAAGVGVGEVGHAVARATVSSSDPTVVQYAPIGELPATLRLMLLKQGSAWVRMRVDEAFDSVRVDVITMPPNDSLVEYGRAGADDAAHSRQIRPTRDRPARPAGPAAPPAPPAPGPRRS